MTDTLVGQILSKTAGATFSKWLKSDPARIDGEQAETVVLQPHYPFELLGQANLPRLLVAWDTV